jgi:hypothetical protein
MQYQLQLIDFKYHKLNCHRLIVIQFNDTDSTATFVLNTYPNVVWFSHTCQCIHKLGILYHCAESRHIKNRCSVCALLGIFMRYLMEEFTNAFNIYIKCMAQTELLHNFN